MFTVALTGGIGSGKSAVSDEFARLGVTVVDADLVARDLVARGEPLLARIVARFGEQLLLDNGELDRKALRMRVFEDPSERNWLNNLLHPAIRKRMMSLARRADSPYALAVIPLLAESGDTADFDRILVVDVPESLQLQRTMVRDEITQVQAQAMLDAQAGRQERLAIADDVIENTGSLEDLYRQIRQLHDNYTTLARNKTSRR